MNVSEVMTEDPICCSPRDSIQEVASQMAKQNCGEIPIVDDQRRPIGVVTDRDICCRAVAKGRDPASTSAREVMTEPVITVTPDDSIETCCRRMENNQIRRIPVIDEDDVICGIVAQADIALMTSEETIAEIVRDISRPTQGDGFRLGL